MRCSLSTLALAAALSGAPALAAEAPPGATIVRIEGDLAYIDSGTATHLSRGQVIQVLRTVVAKHPVSGDSLTDHFPLGVMSISEVGEVLSYGRVDRKLVGVVKVGDVVRFRAALPPEPKPAASPTPAAAPPQAVEMSRIWSLTFGKQPEDRAEILTNYLEAHPDSPFEQRLRREIASFEAMAADLRAAAGANARIIAADAASRAASPPPPPRPAPLTFQAALPEHLYTGDTVELAIFTRTPARVAAAFVYARVPEGLTYTRIPLVADGDGYFRGALPAALIQPPAVELFVEAVDVNGPTVTTGTEAEPRSIPISPLPGGPASPGPGHSAVRVFSEAVDWNRFRFNDWHALVESDFMYRLGGTLYSVRLGFGALRGRGGKVADLDGSDTSKNQGREVGFNYGYIEGELRFGRMIGLAARLTAGETFAGPGVGAEVKLRIGPETGTNLVIGGSLVSDLGALAQLALEWDVIKMLPMSASVIVTNQPAGEDVGVRFVYQIGLRVRPWLQPALRIGYDARNIDHGGFSIGLGLVMGW